MLGKWPSAGFCGPFGPGLACEPGPARSSNVEGWQSPCQDSEDRRLLKPTPAAVPPSGGQIQHRVFFLLVNSVFEAGFLRAGLHLDTREAGKSKTFKDLVHHIFISLVLKTNLNLHISSLKYYKYYRMAQIGESSVLCVPQTYNHASNLTLWAVSTDELKYVQLHAIHLTWLSFLRSTHFCWLIVKIMAVRLFPSGFAQDVHVRRTSLDARHSSWWLGDAVWWFDYRRSTTKKPLWVLTVQPVLLINHHELLPLQGCMERSPPVRSGAFLCLPSRVRSSALSVTLTCWLSASGRSLTSAHVKWCVWKEDFGAPVWIFWSKLVLGIK